MEISYPHRIQFHTERDLGQYIERITGSGLFNSCWRRNAQRESVRVPYKYRFRVPPAESYETRYLIAGENILLRSNRNYPPNVRDMPIAFSMNFQRFWQQNPHALSAEIALERGRRQIVDDPENFLDELFVDERLESDEDVLYPGANNLLDGERWHDTANVADLVDKQLLLMRDFVEEHFPLPRGRTHNNLFRRSETHAIHDGPTQTHAFRMLPDDVIAQAGAVPLLDWNNPVIRALEIAFDYRCEDAMTLVQQLAERIMAIGFHVSSHYPDLMFTREGNVPSISVHLKQGVKLVIYAKAEQRLRIEVRYRGSLRKLLRSIEPDDGIPEMIDIAIADATRRVKKCLAPLRTAERVRTDKITRAGEFITHLGRAFNHNPSLIQAFLAIASVTGSQSVPRSADHAPYAYLADNGIVTVAAPLLRNPNVQYVLKPEYRFITAAITMGGYTLGGYEPATD